jgi:YfiH family protein
VWVGSEAAVGLDGRDASILFGIGPARGPAPGRDRIERLRNALGDRIEAVCWARQVHGTELAVVTSPFPDPVRCVGEADALATTERGLGLLVWTADCVPVVLASPRWVAIAHAGWRGSAAGMARRLVEGLTNRFETAAAPVSAFLGPAISSAHYQVGPEVISELAAAGVDPSTWLHGDRVDLRAFLAAQLRTLGVAHIRSIGPCTFSSFRFASYRRDGAAAGRQWSMVYRPTIDHQRSNSDTLPARPSRA